MNQLEADLIEQTILSPSLQDIYQFIERSQMATWDIDNLARKCYQAYGRKVDFKNYQGKPMPDYYDLPHGIKEAWHAVVLFMISNMTASLVKEVQNG